VITIRTAAGAAVYGYMADLLDGGDADLVDVLQGPAWVFRLDAAYIVVCVPVDAEPEVLEDALSCWAGPAWFVWPAELAGGVEFWHVIGSRDDLETGSC
jgi:hypothetical protein